tara:strand:- start:1284 stop:1973 length:690 start_codon:yes stop_codon:yes gene_type:complete
MLLKINKILFHTTLFIALLFSHALLIVNLDSFYEFEFQKNNTSFKTGITKTDLEKIVDNTQDFFNEKSNEKIYMNTYINGVEKQLFNQKEIIHMVDVKVLLNNIKLISVLMWSAVIICILIYFKLNNQNKTKLLKSAAKSYLKFSFSITAIILIAILIGFRWIFYLFHIISFDNDLWILDPRKDYLIKIFEEIFFMDATLIIGIFTLSSSIIFLLISNIINKYNQKGKN